MPEESKTLNNRVYKVVFFFFLIVRWNCIKYKQIYEKFRIEGGIQKLTTLIGQSLKMVLEYQNHQIWILIFFLKHFLQEFAGLLPVGKKHKI